MKGENNIYKVFFNLIRNWGGVALLVVGVFALSSCPQPNAQSYNIGDFTLSYGDSKTLLAPNTQKTFTKDKTATTIPDAKVAYSLDSVSISKKFKIDEKTGVITTPKDLPIGTYTLKITATAGSGTTYTGSKVATLTIVVKKADIKKYTLSYGDTKNLASSNTARTFTVDKTATTIPSGADVTYSLKTLPTSAKITIDKTTGVITTTAGIPIKTYKLAITAEVPDTNTKYKGTNGATIKIIVKLAVPATALTVSPTTVTLAVNETQQLKTTVTPTDTTDTITYKSSDESIATVDTNGLVIAKKVGKAKVTVGAGKYTATSTIEVLPKAAYKPDPAQSASITFFTIGDADNPYLVLAKGATDKSKVTGAKITLIDADTGKPLYDGTDTTKAKFTKGTETTVGLGIPNGKIKFANIPDKTKITVIAEVTIDGTIQKSAITVTKAATSDIYSWRDLDKIRDNLSGTYALKNDMAFPTDNTYGYGTKFTPIGNDKTKFTGILDGKNHTIKGLHINEGSKAYVGLFGYVKGPTAMIKNLTIDHCRRLGGSGKWRHHRRLCYGRREWRSSSRRFAGSGKFHHHRRLCDR
jgi:hypothetical protein